MCKFVRALSLGLLVIPVIFISAQDEEILHYRVAEVIDLGRVTGPLRTSAFLSPDGSRYAYFEGTSICLYSLPDNKEEACYNFAEDDRVRPHLETVRWSPDGRHLTFVDLDALQNLADSDIRLLDVEEGEIRNLTDDGYMGRIVVAMDEFDSTVNVDIAVAWSDDGRLAILRYPIETEGDRATEMEIIIANPETGETELLVDWSLEQPFLGYSLAWSQNTIAVGRAPARRGEGLEGIDLFNAETGQREREVRVSENLSNVFALQFSADDAYLLAYNPFYRGLYGMSLEDAEFDGVGFIELSNGSDQELNDDLFVIQAGFAPEGSAIAYLAQVIPGEEGGGLYIAPSPDEPAELVLPMERPDAPTSFSHAPLVWATNNTIMIRENEALHAMLVVLEVTD